MFEIIYDCRVTQSLSDIFCSKCHENIGEAVEREEKLCHEVVIVREFTCLGDGVSAGGGCEAVVTVTRRCALVMFRECEVSSMPEGG